MNEGQGNGELSGRVAVVTGASRGIGAAIARTLAEAGACVVLTGRNPKAGDLAVSALRDQGAAAAFVVADQGEDGDWAKVVEAAETGFGGLDILVLNAGVAASVPTLDLTLPEFREMNRINLKGAFLGLKHGVAAMRRQGRGGSVVVISSIAGGVGVPDSLHYTASKAGVRMLAKAAALELGPEKIRVNAIRPGMTRTDMTAGFPAGLAGMIPLGRFGEPDEVAKAALFLACDRSIFMTGAEIVIDGGWTTQ